MKNDKLPPDSPASRTGRARKRRSRPTPKWLVRSTELNQIAQRRCLMILSVLSGEKSVTDTIDHAQISRGTYYDLEERALRAMLTALSPLSGPEGTETQALETALGRIAELERKLRRVEQDKRRGERLLYMTRKLIKSGPVKTASGWPQGRARSRRSTPSGNPSSIGSPSSSTTTSPSSVASIPTKAGEAAH